VPPTTNEQVIDWQFTVSEGGLTSRYGMLGGFFYKQFLPGGLVLPVINPPRRISAIQFTMARNLWREQQSRRP
jgi:hypothetical protein